MDVVMDIEKIQDLEMIKWGSRHIAFFSTFFQILPTLRNHMISTGKNHLVSANNDEVSEQFISLCYCHWKGE